MLWGSSIRIQSGANGTFGAIKFRFQQGVLWACFFWRRPTFRRYTVWPSKCAWPKYISRPQCTMCTCVTKRSAGLNKLGHILKCLFYYFIQHIFVPSRSVRRNMGKFQFSWASNSKFVIFSQIFPCSNYRFHQGNRQNPANLHWNSIIPL